MIPRGAGTGSRGTDSELRGAAGSRLARMVMLSDRGNSEDHEQEDRAEDQGWQGDEGEFLEDSEAVCMQEGGEQEDQHLWGRIRHEAKVEELQQEAPGNRAAAVEKAVRQLWLAARGPDYTISGETLVEMAVGRDWEDGAAGNLWQAFQLEEERGRLERYAGWVEECCEEWFLREYE